MPKLDSTKPSKDARNLAKTLRRLIRAEFPGAFVRSIDGEHPTQAALEIGLVDDDGQCELRVSIEDALAPLGRDLTAEREAAI
jgi:hypothetical protein